MITGSIEQSLVDIPVVRADSFDVADAVGVLPLGRANVQEPLQRLGVLFCPILPIGAEWIPELPQPFFVGIAVLDDQRLDALRVHGRQAEAYRRAIVHDVKAVGFEPEFAGKGVDDRARLSKV